MSALTGIKVSLVAGVHWVRCIVLAMLAHLREREPRLLMVKEEQKRDKEVKDEAIFLPARPCMARLGNYRSPACVGPVALRPRLRSFKYGLIGSSASNA